MSQKLQKNTPPVFHEGDLAEGTLITGALAVDTETMGLRTHRDPLCLVQLAGEDGVAHIVRPDRATYDAPRLKALLADAARVKIFHYARFDVAALRHYLGVDATPVYCTKIASKLARTYTSRHGLKDLCRDLLKVELSKQQQESDWGAPALSESQLAYAAGDVLHLHALRAELDAMLAREGRQDLAQTCFSALPTVVALDLAGWESDELFAH